MTRFMCFCPWLLAATMTAQVAPAPSAPGAKPGSIEGTVVNAVTHQPIHKAVVAVSDRRSQYSSVGVTDDAGKFTIAGLAPGLYIVFRVAAQGYEFHPPGRNAVAGSPIAVAEEQQVTGVAIELTPLGAMAGKVVDEDGEPLRDVRIQAVRCEYPNGLRRYSMVGGSFTDDRGEFRVFDLSPGRYYVRAWLPPSAGYQRRRTASEALPPNIHSTIPDLEYALAYFPDAGDLASATASLVAPGSETSGLEIRLHPVPVFHIRGKVSNLPREPSRQLGARGCGRVEVANPSWLYIASTEADGSFDFAGVTPGAYCVMLIPAGRDPSVYAGQTVTITDRNLENVNLAAAPAIPLSGAVRIEGQGDLPPRLTVTVQNLADRMGASGQVRDGRFSLNISPDTYHVSLGPLPQAMYLKSMQYGAQEMPNGVVPIRGDGSLLALVIATDAGSLSGMVQTENGSPAAGAMVAAVPDDLPPGRSDLVKAAIADPAGKFNIAGVPPGPLKVYAWESSEYYSLSMVPEFVNEFSGYAAAATVSPGGAGSVEVKLIPSEEAQRVKARF